MKNRKLTIIFGAVLTVTVLLSGCATLRPADEGQILEIIELINTGDSENLFGRSSDIFLLDTEILYSPENVKSFWEGLAESGFKLQNPVIESYRLLLPTDRQLFGGGREIEIFFSKYIPEQASLFKIGTSSGTYIFILGPSDIGKSIITAWGGPY